jgi:hypothetical protein
MVVLYNGEKREYNITENCNWEQILECIERNNSLIGKQYGDYAVISTDYDWFTMQQKNVVRCVRCGHEKSVANLANFIRGRAEGGRCECGKKKNLPKEPKKQPQEYIGEEHHGFRIVNYEHGKGYRVECLNCGKQKWESKNHILNGTVTCNHKIVTDYSNPKYIGMKVGYLTAIERIGRKYRFRCDCGTEVIQCPGDVFKQHSVVSCGRRECEYRRKSLYVGSETRKNGIAFEFQCADELEQQGFLVEMTPSTGDYGVDFFAMIGGERVAFQCKKTKTASVIHAVQEVYAGGRYYDCSKFVVVSPSGFSYPAELMASKLGVQLEENLLNFQIKKE